MNSTIDKFLSRESYRTFFKSRSVFFKTRKNTGSLSFLVDLLEKWKEEGVLGKVIELKEFNDFFDTASPFFSRDEVKLFYALLESGIPESKDNSRLLLKIKNRLSSSSSGFSPFTRGVKLKEDALSSYAKNLQTKIDNLENIRSRGKKRMLELKEKIKLNKKNPEKRHKITEQKIQLSAAGDKVLKACDLIYKKTEEKNVIDEMKNSCVEVENFLISDTVKIQKNVSSLRLTVERIWEKLSRIESLWEKVDDIPTKFSLEEERLRKIKKEILQNRESNERHVKRVEIFNDKLSKTREEVRKIEDMLRVLRDYPNILPHCKESVIANRENIFLAQKDLKELREEYETLKEKQNVQLIRYETLLNSQRELQNDQSFFLNNLLEEVGSNLGKARSASVKLSKVFLHIARGWMVLERFIVESMKMSKSLSLGLASVKKMEVDIKAQEKSLSRWSALIEKSKENETFQVAIKTDTLMEDIRNKSGFTQMLPMKPDREAISELLARNYEQEKEANEFEMDGISKIISMKSSFDLDSFLKSGENRRLLANHGSLKNQKNAVTAKFFKWINREKHRQRREKRIEYPGDKFFLYAKRVGAVFLVMGGLAYYSHNISLKVDAHIPAAKPELRNQTDHSGQKEYLTPGVDFNEIFNNSIYGDLAVEASAGGNQNIKKRWKIFLPLFKDFLIHWQLENRPMLINNSGDIPGSRSVESMRLFEEIAKRINGAYGGFFSRLYIDFVDLGISPEEAVKSIIANEKIDLAWPNKTKVYFRGRNSPLKGLDEMDHSQFMEKIPPYIAREYSLYSKSNGMEIPENLAVYARILAEDIFFSSRAFHVPLTSMISIAHQETFFMNILGDGAKSAGPFQLYEPTRDLIIREMNQVGLKVPKKAGKLENHITFSVYMAAFHFSTLMKRYSDYKGNPLTGKLEKVIVDIDKSIQLYNGHIRYPFRVLKRNLSLKSYLKASGIS